MLCAGDQARLLQGIIPANSLWIGKSCAPCELVAREAVNLLQETGASSLSDLGLLVGLLLVICRQME